MTILYHGSKSLFDKFDYSKMGLNGTAEGYGFYFTDNKEIASNYANNGFLYTVQFNGKKELSSTKKTITKSQLKKFFIKLDELGEHLSNYGDKDYEGYSNVLQSAIDSEYDYNDNDMDLVCSIANSFGSRETVLTELYNMFGYDHTKVLAEWDHNTGQENNVYVALVNEAISIDKVERIIL